ncbi:MAG TPA: hypothetical protein VN764_04110 [Polyangiaceae bacterium]|nr:hypothetical protein [Polyangiaceae bacterium]
MGQGRPAPALTEYERAICQGSDHPILRDSATLLFTLAQRARVNPRLVTNYMDAALKTVALQDDLAIRSTVDARTQDRLAALCEPDHPCPGG